MSNTYRANRKVTDEELIKLNNLGLSLKTIGSMVGCHPTTVKIRLNDLGVEVTDTRRAFMEDIYNGLTPSAQEWLIKQLEGTSNIKDLVAHFIMGAYLKESRPANQG